MKGKREPWDLCKKILLCLLAGALLVNVKSLFVDYDIDPQYAVAMSYRMLQGDRMFLQMWEPHQTSAFLCTFFMWIYISITGTTTGMVLFLQGVGVLIQGGIALIVYRVMKPRIEMIPAALMSIFFLAVRPKDIVFPEFSNMQIWFSVLLFVCLVKYLERQEKKRWLIIASVCLCLKIISYPGCIVTYFGVIFLLMLYSKQKWKDSLLFSGACMLQGCAYVAFFVLRIGSKQFVQSLHYILGGDQSHDGISFLQGGISGEYFIKGILWLLFCFLCAVLTEWSISRWNGKVFTRISGGKWIRIALCFWGWLLIADVIAVFATRVRQMYNVLFLILIAVALWGRRFCSKQERRIVVVGMILAAGSFVGTAFLTNLGFMETVKYLILAVMVAFISVGRSLEYYVAPSLKCGRWVLLFAFCLVILFRRGVLVKTTGGVEYSLLDMGGIIKQGPEVGIIMNYMGAYRANCTYEEWKRFVKPGDSVLLASNNSVMYTFEDVVVSTKSTICTPTFDELQLEYWKQNPGHTPNVVVVECWYGDVREDENSWIMQWVLQNPKGYTWEDGAYWRYYRIGEE